jgi:MFS family permease
MPFGTGSRLPRSVLSIGAGRAISFLGDEVALLAIAFRAKDELGHFGVAAILIAGFVPLLVLSPVTGLVVDRFRARPILVAVSLAQGAICLGLAWSGPVLLVPLVALLACGTALSSPAWSALVPRLVSDDQLPSAMGLLQSAQAAAGVGGPFLGGLLVGVYGFHVPLVIDAASFLVLAFVPVVLRVDRVPTGAGGGFSVREAFAGITLVARQPVLRSLVTLVVCFVVCLGVVNVAEIYFVTLSLHTGPFGYGLLGLSLGVGMLLTNAAAGALSRRGFRPEPTFVVGCVGLCVAIGGFALTDALWQAACVLFLAGVCNALVNVNAMVLITRGAADEVRGRVFAAVSGVVSAGQIGALATGGLLLLVIAPRTLILGGAAASAVALCLTVGPVLRASVASPLAEDGDGGLLELEANAATA